MTVELRRGLLAALALGIGVLAVYSAAGAVALVLALGLALVLARGARSLAVWTAGAVAVEAFAGATGWRSPRLVELAAAALLVCALVVAGSAGLRVAAPLAAGVCLVLWMPIAAAWSGGSGDAIARAGAGLAVAAAVAAPTTTRRRLHDVLDALAVAALALAVVLVVEQAARSAVLANDFAPFALVAFPLALASSRRPLQRVVAPGLALVLAATHDWRVLVPAAAALAVTRPPVRLAHVLAAAAAGALLGLWPWLDRGQDLLARGRASGYARAWDAFSNHTWTGAGAGSLDGAGGTYAHALGELGIPGLVLVLLVLAAAAVAARRDRRVAAAVGMLAAAAFLVPIERSLLAWVVVGLAAAVGAWAPAYDLPVRVRLVEQRERRVEELRAELAAEWKLLERRRAALDARAGELEARARELEARASALERAERERERLETALAERERAASRAQAELAERERAVAEAEAAVPEAPPTDDELAALSADLVRRSTAVTERERELAERERALAAQRARLLEAAQQELVRREAAEPQPPRRGASWNVDDLERLVEARAAEFPQRVDEWRFLVRYLRDFVDESGRLADDFDWLVADSFAELLR